MANARTRWLALPLLGLLGLSAAGCGGDELPPPEGFILAVKFVSLDPSVLTNLDINIEPQGMDENFMALAMPITFDQNGTITDDGPITYDVADDGVLEIDVTGSHVDGNSVDNGDGTFTFEFQMWSAVLECNAEGRDCQISQESRARTPAPLVTVIANRGDQVLGDERLFLTQWPLPVDGSANIEVQCRAGMATICQP